jgi:hypothetical protein
VLVYEIFYLNDIIETCCENGIADMKLQRKFAKQKKLLTVITPIPPYCVVLKGPQVLGTGTGRNHVVSPMVLGCDREVSRKVAGLALRLRVRSPVDQ